MLFCEMTDTWPWISQCQDLKQSYEDCRSTYECKLSDFCWYATKDDVESDVKRCLPLYSQSIGTKFGWKELDDAETNEPSVFGHEWQEAYLGQFCKSGLAFKHENWR